MPEMIPGPEAWARGRNRWPPLPFGRWRETCAALHLFTQVVGKYRLAHTPWTNHSWHATLYVTARGLTTSLVPDGPDGIEVEFDLVDQALLARSGAGACARFPIEPMPVAVFHRRFADLVRAVGGRPDFDGLPNEIADPVRFLDDTRERPYDAAAVRDFHRVLLSVDRVFSRFRTGFLGKVSPSHLFWGSFDLAVTRFSGEPAPLHPGGIPALPDAITQEAYSHQVSSAGFWPGGGPVDEAAFYSYAYPGPEGFAAARVDPRQAYYDDKAGEFILRYDDVQAAEDPEGVLMCFLQSAYSAAADLGQWNRSMLDCPWGEPRRPRAVNIASPG